MTPKTFLKDLQRGIAVSTIVHVVGTGTIGEPLIGLFSDFGHRLGVDEVTFHKRTPPQVRQGGASPI